MAKFQFSKLAERDLEDIAAYSVSNFGVSKAQEYKALLSQSAKTAASFRSIGQTYITEQGSVFQRFHVGRHVLFYQSVETGIIIVRVLHLMMDFDRYLG